VALVLAIEPDPRQAAVIKHALKEEVQAELVVADSKDAALAAIATHVPDVILLSVLLPPRDEQELADRLRDLEGAAHLLTLTIPLLARPEPPRDGRGRFLKFSRRRPAEPTEGCDPLVFAREVGAYLQRAAEMRQAANAAVAAAERERRAALALVKTPERTADLDAPGAASGLEAPEAAAIGGTFATPPIVEAETSPTTPGDFESRAEGTRDGRDDSQGEESRIEEPPGDEPPSDGQRDTVTPSIVESWLSAAIADRAALNASADDPAPPSSPLEEMTIELQPPASPAIVDGANGNESETEPIVTLSEPGVPDVLATERVHPAAAVAPDIVSEVDHGTDMSVVALRDALQEVAAVHEWEGAPADDRGAAGDLAPEYAVGAAFEPEAQAEVASEPLIRPPVAIEPSPASPSEDLPPELAEAPPPQRPVWEMPPDTTDWWPRLESHVSIPTDTERQSGIDAAVEVWGALAEEHLSPPGLECYVSLTRPEPQQDAPEPTIELGELLSPTLGASWPLQSDISIPPPSGACEPAARDRSAETDRQPAAPSDQAAAPTPAVVVDTSDRAWITRTFEALRKDIARLRAARKPAEPSPPPPEPAPAAHKRVEPPPPPNEPALAAPEAPEEAPRAAEAPAAAAAASATIAQQPSDDTSPRARPAGDRQARASRRRPPAKRRPRKPACDEWGMYDPAQCGFEALMARLDAQAEPDDGKGPTAADLLLDQDEDSSEGNEPGPPARGQKASGVTPRSPHNGHGARRLAPLAMWVHCPAQEPAVPLDDAERGAGLEIIDLVGGLRLPASVAMVRYASGCRIRRVRVKTLPSKADPDALLVIVSKSALREVRGDASKGRRGARQSG
jgi:CheY-like chemotaxis protein